MKLLKDILFIFTLGFAAIGGMHAADWLLPDPEKKVYLYLCPDSGAPECFLINK